MHAAYVAFGGLALFALVFLLDPFFFKRRHRRHPKPLGLALTQTKLDGFAPADSTKDS